MVIDFTKLKGRRTLDPRTLEVVAETICGRSATSGRDLEMPGPYRTMREIIDFFDAIGFDFDPGRGTSRMDFSLGLLEAINKESWADLLKDSFSFVGTDLVDRLFDNQPDILPGGLQLVLLRLIDPKEYIGNTSSLKQVLDQLNRVLVLEGLELYLDGVQPRLREVVPKLPEGEPVEFKREEPPRFGLLVSDSALAGILTSRWNEAQDCVDTGAYLSAVILMGSILEGVLLAKAEKDFTAAKTSSRAPRKGGAVKSLEKWKLAELINVAHDAKWIQLDVQRFSHALRESRNLVHPHYQRQMEFHPTEETCAICWEVVKACVKQALGAE